MFSVQGCGFLGYFDAHALLLSRACWCFVFVFRVSCFVLWVQGSGFREYFDMPSFVLARSGVLCSAFGVNGVGCGV